MADFFNVLVNAKDGSKEVKASGDKTLLEVIRENGFLIDAPCGGAGTCGRCLVFVTGPCADNMGNVKTYENEKIKACSVRAAGKVTVSLLDIAAKKEKVLTDEVDIEPGGEGLGLAIDIGTTTVAAYVYDLTTGKCIGKKGEMNAQRMFGGDVISRIHHAEKEENLKEMQDAIVGQITALAKDLTDDISKITYVSVAGNTTMEHIFMGLSPVSIGVAPFKTLSLFGEECDASVVFKGFAKDCKLYVAPAVAGYVGGDITAGIMSSGIYLSEKPVLFIDVGTNGEMAVGNKDGFVTCACAAGPAFEGAGIECGSPARDGAIDTVKPDLSYHVIGDVDAKSICGSGLIDASAALLKNEHIEDTGAMEEDYHFNDEVYLSGKDVRQMQLAKAAVRAGIETLLKVTGNSYDDIDSVVIAGGFGNYMKIKSACAIGLLPPAFMDKAKQAGNTAGKGAAMALTPAGRKKLSEVDKLCKYEELSSSAVFNDEYVDAMFFDEWDEVF